MEKPRRSCLLVVAVFLATCLVVDSARAVTVRVETSSGASTSATYYTQDGDWATGDATVSPTGDIGLSTSGSVEKGLIRAESGGGDRAFTPYTGDFSATATAGAGGGAVSSATSANERVDIFVVTQPGNSTLQNYAPLTYGDIGTAVGAAAGGSDGPNPDWILVDQGTGVNSYTEQVAIDGFEADSALTAVWGADDTTIDAGGPGGHAVGIANSPGFALEGFTATGAESLFDGINVALSPDAQILCNTVTNNEEDGIVVDGSAGVLIRNNTVTNNGLILPPAGVEDQQVGTTGSGNVRGANNTVNSFGTIDGISVSDSPFAQIINNTIANNRALGISLWNSPGARITNNIVRDNQSSVLAVAPSDASGIANISAAFGGGGGLEVVSSDNVRITNNIITNNGGIISTLSVNDGQVQLPPIGSANGISVSSSQGAQITNNIITNNGGAIITLSGNDAQINNFAAIAGNGISVSDSQGVQITNNTVNNNKGNGILVDNSDDSQITNNTVSNNQGNGINVASNNVGITRNAITGNGTGLLVNVGGIYVGPSSMGTTINENNIAGNADYGLWNDTTSDVDAQSNWWGQAAGPSYEVTASVGIPGTFGTDIWDAAPATTANSVDYQPFATTPFSLP